MRRPRRWIRRLVCLALLLILGQYAALMWLAPRSLTTLIEYVAGGELTVGEARLSFPLTTTLTNLRVTNHDADTAFTIQRVVIKPRWLSLRLRTLWIDELAIEQPLLRVTRAADGAWHWPNIPPERLRDGASAFASLFRFGIGSGAPPWTIRIRAFSIEDGVIDVVDGRPAPPFHGAVDHLSLTAGPVRVPLSRAALSSLTTGGMAVRAQVIGADGSAAPAYCSGWLDLDQHAMEGSCQLAPLPLAAFNPYYHALSDLRVSSTTLAATIRWGAKGNELDSRAQLVFDHLDISIRGKTPADVKKVTAGREPRLIGAIDLTGPFDRPRAWHAELIPGDEPAQQLVKRWLDRGVEVIRIPWWGGRLQLSLNPGSRSAMTDIETASREIQEALEILAFPTAEPAPAAADEPFLSPVQAEVPEPTAPAAAPSTAELSAPDATSDGSASVISPAVSPPSSPAPSTRSPADSLTTPPQQTPPQ